MVRSDEEEVLFDEEELVLELDVESSTLPNANPIKHKATKTEPARNILPPSLTLTVVTVELLMMIYWFDWHSDRHVLVALSSQRNASTVVPLRVASSTHGL